MDNPNVLLLTLDEVRADDLSCYGQKKIKTSFMDSWAKDGVLFEETRNSAPFTPVSIASLLSGVYPNKHFRRSHDKIWTPPVSLAEIMKRNGYKTSAWTGAPPLASKFGYNAGFDEFKEPNKYLGMRAFYPEFASLSDEEFNKRMLEIHREAGATDEAGNLPVKYWWINEVISWLQKNRNEKFFIWCHLTETHAGFENFLIYHGLLKKGEHTENRYHLGHVLLADEYVVRPLLETLKKLELYDNTLMILQSDHGTTCQGRPGEIPLPVHTFSPWRGPYPWHPTLRETDVRIVNIWRGPGLEKGVRVKGQVRQVDTVPTILDLCGIDPPNITEFDGISLLPFINRGKAEGLTAYIEHLQENRQFGCQQAICTGRYKFIRNLTTGSEELYDLEYDPEERVNLLNSSVVPFGDIRKSTPLEEPLNMEQLVEWRRMMNKYLLDVTVLNRLKR